jgi:hypothetical protein
VTGRLCVCLSAGDCLFGEVMHRRGCLSHTHSQLKKKRRNDDSTKRLLSCLPTAHGLVWQAPLPSSVKTWIPSLSSAFHDINNFTTGIWSPQNPPPPLPQKKCAIICQHHNRNKKESMCDKNE